MAMVAMLLCWHLYGPYTIRDTLDLERDDQTLSKAGLTVPLLLSEWYRASSMCRAIVVASDIGRQRTGMTRPATSTQQPSSSGCSDAEAEGQGPVATNATLEVYNVVC